MTLDIGVRKIQDLIVINHRDLGLKLLRRFICNIYRMLQCDEKLTFSSIQCLTVCSGKGQTIASATVLAQPFVSLSTSRACKRLNCTRGFATQNATRYVQQQYVLSAAWPWNTLTHCLVLLITIQQFWRNNTGASLSTTNPTWRAHSYSNSLSTNN